MQRFLCHIKTACIQYYYIVYRLYYFMDIKETLVVPKDTMMDIIHCMEVMLLLIAENKSPTDDQLTKIRYCNKTFSQAMELFNKLQNQLNK